MCTSFMLFIFYLLVCHSFHFQRLLMNFVSFLLLTYIEMKSFLWQRWFPNLPLRGGGWGGCYSSRPALFQSVMFEVCNFQQLLNENTEHSVKFCLCDFELLSPLCFVCSVASMLAQKLTLKVTVTLYGL